MVWATLTMTQVAPVDLRPGMKLYKYKLVSCIGRGYFGEVWLADDLAVQKKYAVKVLQPGVPSDERLREARIGSQLNHNNLVHVHYADVVSVEGQDVVILVMDYLPKGSAERLANPARYLPLPDALQITRDILLGLEHLHTQRLYHNDIKPGNILLGTQGQAMLSDYGVTGISLNGAPVTAPSAYFLHRAPEVVVARDIGVSSDIFQVGMTLARLLVHLDLLGAIQARIGDKQYKEDAAAGKLITKKHFGRHIPAAVRRVVLKAIHPDPTRRYSGALQMRRELEKLDYPGYWTVSEDGSEVGICGKYQFFYMISSVTSIKFDVICMKRNVDSGRTQRVTRFCKQYQTEKQADKLVADFKDFVVTKK